jgi:hypothetical protein
VSRPVARRARLLPAAGLAAVVLSGSLSSCSLLESEEAHGTPAEPAPVALKAAQAPDDLAIGVVVSLTGEGSDWSETAEGARVATYRYGLGERAVDLRPVDDKGTARGATAAVRTLVDAGVAGIVVATEGEHVRAAVKAATDAGVPVLLPYETDTAGLPDGAWLTGPDREQVVSALARALAADGLGRPVVVDAGGGAPSGIDALSTYPFRAGGDASRIAGRIARQTRSGARVDSVVVTGPAAQQATVVRALQGENVQVPVLLTPDALSPVFATTLVALDGTLAGRLTTVGPDAADVAAMTPGAEGQALSAYFAALRATAGDDGVEDFFDAEPFGGVSDTADTRSHDAVVALVTAAAEAGSDAPEAVTKALSGLTVTRADGLAGPELDFSAPSALADDAVTALQASTQSPGLRPASPKPEPRLFWFTAPTD